MREKKAEKGKSFTRRDFLKTTGGAAALAGVGATGLILNPREANATELPKKWDKDVDVVVVGCGGAGMLAAIEAADVGAKTLVLESEPVRSGSSPLSGGVLTLCETELEPGSRDELFADLMEAHHQDSMAELSRVYVDNAGETYRRLKEVGVKFTGASYFSHMKKPWGHTVTTAGEMCSTLERAVRKRGVEILLKTRGRRLIRSENKRVLGIEVESKGKKQYFRARKAVVLGTGGFTRNPELAKNFGRPGAEEVVPTTGLGSRGDGLIMGWDLGADMTYMSLGVGPTAPADKVTKKTVLTFYSGAIIVNKEGKRFHRESELYTDICWTGLKQTDVLMIQLYDAKIKEALTGTALGNLMEGCKEHQARSITELASELREVCGLNVDGMIKTVADYNATVVAGHDPEFGRKHLVGISGNLVKIDTPPYYAVVSVPGTTHFNGGLFINADMQVKDVYGDIIPGLYAAGEVTGGFHGAGYMSGSALGMAIIYGRIAGKNAAAEKPWS